MSLILERKLTQREAYAMEALNHILTGTTYSRIFGKARERGLVYSIYSDYDERHHDCCWDFAGQVMPETAEALFDLIIDELKQVAAGKITKKEIDETKSYGLGSFQINTQTISQLANFYGEEYFTNHKIRSYATVPNHWAKISKAEIVAIVQKEFDNLRNTLLEKLNAKLKKVFKG